MHRGELVFLLFLYPIEGIDWFPSADDTYGQYEDVAIIYGK